MMELKKENLPTNLSLCHEIIVELLDKNQQSQVLIEKLQHQLEQLLKARYGPRADRIHPDQMEIFARELLAQSAPELEEPEEVSPGAPKKAGHGRKALPKNLPRVRKEHDVEPEEKRCKQCGQEKRRIREEVSEQLDYIPAALQVIEHARFVYACPNECEGEVVTAVKPLQAIEKGLPGPGLLAKVATAKYCEHLPLHRQESILARHGVKIARSTQCDWMRACAELVEPLHRLMKERVLSSRKIHTDDTPIRVLDKSQTKTKTGRIWVYIGDRANPYVVYEYTPSRKRDGPRNFLGGYEGYLQADAYGGYDGIYAGGKVKEVACWAHARRKFVEAQTTHPPGAVTAVAWIKKLYGVEREARAYLESLPPEEAYATFFPKRREWREEKAKPLLQEFGEWLLEQEREALPKSPFRQAVTYTRHNWKALNRYVEDGELEIDNNVAERALRCIAIGRKNWLFAGSDRGGRTAAVLYSFGTTCRNLEIDPFVYFRDVFDRISAHPMNRLEELLPDRWKKIRKEKALQASTNKPT
jgi:transposase